MIGGEGEMLEPGLPNSMGLAEQPVDIVREKRAETEYNHSLACAVVHNYARTSFKSVVGAAVEGAETINNSCTLSIVLPLKAIQCGPLNVGV